jgi:molybdopterin converting factor small subunit
VRALGALLFNAAMRAMLLAFWTVSNATPQTVSPQPSPLEKWERRTNIDAVKVRVQFYAQLSDLAGMRELGVNLPEGATIRDLLDQIYARQPALRPHDKTILIGAGVEFVDRGHKLKPGEEISIMPPVQGG